MNFDRTIQELSSNIGIARDQLDTFGTPAFKPTYLGGGGKTRDFDEFLTSILTGGAAMKWYEHLAVVLLLLGAINWLFVLINYNVADVEGGAFGGVVPDLVADFFKLPPDGLNKKSGDDQAGYIQACQAVQTVVYVLVGIAGIIGITMLARINHGAPRSLLATLALVVVIVGALNWIITNINMYAFQSTDGGSSGYAPDLIFLLSKFAGSDTMKTSPFPADGSGTSPSEVTVQAVTITQQVVYALVALAALILVVLRFTNPSVFNM